MQRIIIVTAHANTLVRFRCELIKEWCKRGYEVIALGPEEGYQERLASCGAFYVALPFSPTSVSPVSDIRLVKELVSVFNELAPDIVFLYHIKPVIYGSIAAVLAKVPKTYSMITGLGYTFTGTTFKKKILRTIVSMQYRVALRGNRRVFFQNPDDMRLFKDYGLVTRDEDVVLINGSGVNIDEFQYSCPPKETITFMFMGRLLQDKGIINFVEAAEIIKGKFDHVNFQVLGSIDSNPSAISKEQLGSWVERGIIEYVGYTEDVRPFIAQCSVFVLPSYREGVPRSTLEAMAMGRAVITTDTPGCRETVIDGENGFLVPVDDSQALAKAMERMIRNSRLIYSFGLRSRELAKQKFDVHKVNDVILEAMEIS